MRYVDPSGHEKTVPFADRFEGHVAEQTIFSKEHGVFVYYDTPLAKKVNEMIKQNQIQTPKVDAPNDGRRGEEGSGTGSWEAQTPRTGEEWNKYFQDMYGAENVQWKPRSFEHMVENPQTLYGSTQSEIAQILGEGWTMDSYGNSGTRWKFINDKHSDLMVFYHNADGVHGGAYYGFSSGQTGTVKLVGKDYISLSGDKAIIYQMQ